MAVAADDFRVAGVDLAAGEENETGFAVIEGLKLHTSGLFTLDEITDVWKIGRASCRERV